jgi:deoxyribonuclease-4
MTREEALSLAGDTLLKAFIALKENNLDSIHICPETMGKINQLGTLDEVMYLCSINDSFIPAIDFGHLNARTFGGIKTKEEYSAILDTIENKLGSDRLKYMHCHFSKIQYTIGGEKKHLTFEDTEFGPDFEPLAELLYKRNLAPTIICESDSVMVEDALKMKKIYENLK